MKSNLVEKLLSICGESKDTFGINPEFGINNLTEEQRVQVEAELIKHFEFEKIVWMNLPAGLAEDNSTPIVAKTIQLSDSDNPVHKHKVGYIYKIVYTPKMYEPGELYKPVKDGCVFAPITYTPETFLPKQSITLTWSPDVDNPKRTFEEEKEILREMLEKVLANPEEYRPKGHIGCLLRYAAL